MISYFLSFSVPDQLIQVRLEINITHNTETCLQIPAWRPGRYQLQAFAKNILNFNVSNEHNENCNWQKTDRNTWKIHSKKSKSLVVTYSYYANELNAGSSFIDHDIQYLNPVNFLLFQESWMHEKVNLHIYSPKNLIATSATNRYQKDKFIIEADSFFEIFDSPIIISEHLKNFEFKVKKIKFRFNWTGFLNIDIDKFKADLSKIAQTQIKLFGQFPEPTYDFLLIIPQLAYYHGVEHSRNTMMVLGNNKELNISYYNDLLGLVSHELFHTWNIAKIRPAELLPYDYIKETYFTTCFVAEGYTTYYGDKMLLKSGVIDLQQYYYELESTLKRHFDHDDNASQSLLESSFDLWVDGYEKAIPNKRVSVYNKGAVAALILDIMIRQKYKEEKSLDDVMRLLWTKYGNMQAGYTYDDIVLICEEVYGQSLTEYFNVLIAGNKSVFEYCNNALSYINLRMIKNREGIVKLLQISQK